MPTKSEQKKALREKCRKKRQKLFDQLNATARNQLPKNFSSAFKHIPAGTVVAGYIPLGSEIDCLPTMAMLQMYGIRLALPVHWGDDEAMEFRAYKMGDELEMGEHKALQPKPEALKVDPDIVIVPLVAFDENGYRLGQGAGLYDRTLEDLRKIKDVAVVGVAFDDQKEKSLPVEKFDQKLDAVITEKGVWMFRKTGKTG